MHRADAADSSEPTGTRRGGHVPASMRFLSHELNSRLDGAIRSVRLAEQSLLGSGSVPAISRLYRKMMSGHLLYVHTPGPSPGIQDFQGGRKRL